MNTTVCPQCGAELQMGDYPFCGAPGGHGSIFRQDALHFDPIVVYEMPDGRHYYPGHASDPAPVKGAKPIVLDTLRKADAFVRQTNQTEQIEMDIRAEHKRNHFDRVTQRNRAQLREELARRGISRANLEAICQDRDGRGPGKEAVMRQFEEVARASGRPFDRAQAERIYEATERTRRNPDYRQRQQSNFQIDVFSNDSSNRMAYKDSRTGWRSKKY